MDQGEDLLVRETMKDSDKSADKGSDSTDDMANVLGTLGAANILAIGGLNCKDLSEYEQAEARLSHDEKVELIDELLIYQRNPTQIKKYQAQQNKPAIKTKRRDFYMSILRSNAGWKVKHFKGMTFEQIEEKFIPVWEKMQDFVPMNSKLESERLKRPGIQLGKESFKKLNTTKALDSKNVLEKGADSKRTNNGSGTEILKMDKEQGKEVSYIVALEEKTTELDEGLAGSDPGKTPESQPLPDNDKMDEDQARSNTGKSHLALAGLNPKPMHDDFMATVYPKVNESLNLPADEQVILEDPLSSSRTLSLIKNLDYTYTFGDQFFNDKPTKDEPGKQNVDTKVISMVTIKIYQAFKSMHPLSTSIINLSKPIQVSSPLQKLSIIPTTKATTTTLPPPQQQGTKNSLLASHVSTLEQRYNDLKKKCKLKDVITKAFSSRILTLKLRDLPHKINQTVNEVVKEAVHVALQAPLQDCFRELPKAEITMSIHTRVSYEKMILTMVMIVHHGSHEFIKSSVEDLVLIPSESKDTFGSDSVCILPLCDDFSSIDIPEEKAVLEDIECKDSYDPNLNESTFLVTPLFDSNKDEYFTPGDDVELLLHRDPSIHVMSVASILEGFTNEPPLEENDDLIDLESKNDEWKKFLYDSPIDD
uniref:Uncharacterized protein n=1 Tax=Tanacetum cinerariifolium TaxID=118510 RepID=A0A6L2MIL9_TANCI|nr:hypothetical protein [Tanacetum cinerariifolium]